MIFCAVVGEERALSLMSKRRHAFIARCVSEVVAARLLTPCSQLLRAPIPQLVDGQVKCAGSEALAWHALCLFNPLLTKCKLRGHRGAAMAACRRQWVSRATQPACVRSRTRARSAPGSPARAGTTHRTTASADCDSLAGRVAARAHERTRASGPLFPPTVAFKVAGQGATSATRPGRAKRGFG